MLLGTVSNDRVKILASPRDFSFYENMEVSEFVPSIYVFGLLSLTHSCKVLSSYQVSGAPCKVYIANFVD